jgi:N-acetyl-anhydromuramyl-L-alanine amidase AmpD
MKVEVGFMNIQTLKLFLPHSSRRVNPNLIVLHATAGASARSSIDYLRGAGLSYHYIIARDGNDTPKSVNANKTESIIFRCVPNTGEAFHVGSTIPTPERGNGINRNSIGISLANIQNKTTPEKYTKQQMDALAELIEQLKAEIPTLEYLTTHAVVQPWNRADPWQVNGSKIAQTAKLKWWQPTQAQVDENRPKKTRVITE